MTAKTDKGEKIFSEQKDYVQYGLTVDDKLRFGAWQIKKFTDFALQPQKIKRETFFISVPEGVKWTEIEMTLRYLHPHAKKEIPIHKVVKKLEF